MLEIGGGFSTLIHQEVMDKNGTGEIWEIEPYPRKFMSSLPRITKFIKKPVQELSLEIFEELNEGDVLFIDSTHTVKESSDCVYIYLK